MATKKVYVIICKTGMTLAVNVDGNQVPMEEFLQTHTPIQVTSAVQLGSLAGHRWAHDRGGCATPTTTPRSDLVAGGATH
jgi:hypothetical protein